jgi:predicted enzyme related to lactoylglutathione lyase
LSIFFSQSNVKTTTKELEQMEPEEALLFYETLLGQKFDEYKEYERMNGNGSKKLS